MNKLKSNILLKYTDKYWINFLFGLLILISLYYKLYWLALFIFLSIVIYKLFIYSIGRLDNKILKRISKALFLFLFVFGLSIFVKLFLVDIYKIPTGSMEDTLLPHDVILVNKLIYGPKLPRSPFEIPWINLLFYMNDTARETMNTQWWPYHRLNGIKGVQQGDVLVYQLSMNFFVVKRCVAIAGQTLSIIDGDIYTNNLKYPSPSSVKNRYRFQVKDRRNFHTKVDSLHLGNTIYRDQRTKNSFKGNFTKEELKRVKTLREVYNVKPIMDTFNLERKLFAIPPDTEWTLDNMGPFIVPKKNTEINLNPTNLAIYKDILKHFEKVDVEQKEGSYFINGIKKRSYTFKQDYYFMMGDNRKASVDSRYIGFIPEENIIGKVQYVLFSNYGDKFRWDRFFKGIL